MPRAEIRLRSIELHAGFHPFPAFFLDRFRFRSEFLHGQAIKQLRVEDEYAVVILCEKITADAATGGFVSLKRHETCPAVTQRDFIFGQGVTDRVGIVV